VASECFWSLSFSFSDPRWIVKHDIAGGQRGWSAPTQDR
jgi:hypothetical protein